jgi:hypothetical protein
MEPENCRVVYSHTAGPRQKLSLATGVKGLYHFHMADEESASQNSSERATGAAEYNEMIWQSNRGVKGTNQHIAVLLEDGEVIARRQVGID